MALKRLLELLKCLFEASTLHPFSSRQNGSDEGWEDSDELIEGVNWAQSGTSVTHGILVWDKPFLIKTADGREVCLPV